MTAHPPPAQGEGRKRLRKDDCPIYCKYCGRRRSRDAVGHYCKTRNCQWANGFAGCLLAHGGKR